MKRFTSIIVLLLILSFSMSPFLVSPAEATENSWTTKASISTARSALGVAVVKGKIYAIGGLKDSYRNTNEEYDPATNTWATKTSMPTPRYGFGIAVYQNKIYVIGGETSLGKLTGVNEVYDPLTDTWETKTSMPINRFGLRANVVNGKIYLIGGVRYYQDTTNPIFLDINEVYDPSTDSWTTKEPIPSAVQGYASAVVNNKIYVISGTAGGKINLNQIYNPVTDTWSYGAQIPTAVSHAAAGATTGVAAPKRIYVIGGRPDGAMDPCNLNQVYDPEKDTWTNGTKMPTSRSSFGVAVVNDMLYAIGGSTSWGQPLTAKNEEYTPLGYETVPPPDTTPPFPTTWIAAAIVITAVVGTALLIYFTKIKKTTGKAEK